MDIRPANGGTDWDAFSPVRARDGQIETGVRMRPFTVSQVALMVLIMPLKDLSRGLT